MNINSKRNNVYIPLRVFRKKKRKKKKIYINRSLKVCKKRKNKIQRETAREREWRALSETQGDVLQGFIPGYVSCLRVSSDMGSILNAWACILTHFHQTDKQNPHTVCFIKKYSTTHRHISTRTNARLSAI